MNTEKRFYLLDVDSIGDFDYLTCTDDQFIEKCEENGSIYTQETFVNDFNMEEFSTSTHQLRVIDVPLAEFVTKEITADTSIYSLDVSLQDILDNAPEEIKKAYKELSKEEQKELIKNNFHGAKTGFEWGISDPISDVMTTISHNLNF